MSDKIRVLVVDDNQVVRLKVRAILQKAGAASVEAVGEAGDGREAVAQVDLLEPDVILMDLVMPTMDGVEASREILSRHRDARIVALTSLGADEQVLAAVRAGVRGYLHKPVTAEALLRALDDVYRGELVFPDALTRKFLASSVDSLTRTEEKLRVVRDEGLLRTKFYRPTVAPDVVVKGDLLARLDAGRRLPLTLVSAPVGYGKTTLVTRWIERRGEPSAWLSLDGTERDTRGFLRHFVAAVRTLFPKACEETAALLEAVEIPSGAALACFLLNDLDAIGESFLVVLDDFHLIEDLAVHELVSHLLKHPPRSLHLVILARHDPPLPLVSLRVAHRMTEIRLQDLRLDEDEIRVFFDKSLGLEVDGSILAGMCCSTEGWPAALRLAALALQHGGDLEEVVHELDASRQMQDYLMEEVLSRQPPEVRVCLAKLVIVNRFCAPLCEALCGRVGEDKTGAPFERLLEGAGLLLIPLDEHHEWYRFHHLFRLLLERELEAGTSAEERAALHRRASGWLGASGFVEPALRHALAGGDTEAAVRLVEEKLDETMNRQQWYLLEGWLEIFPAEVVDTEPLLLLLKSLSWAYRYNDAESWRFLDQAEPLVAARPAESTAGRRLRGIFDLWRCQRCYMTDDTEHALVHAEQALNLLPAQAEDLRGKAVGFLALSLWARGDHERAERVLYDALVAESACHGAFRTRVVLVLGILHWMAGDLSGLERVATGLLELGEKLDLQDTRDWANYYLGVVHYQRGDLEAADRHLMVAVGRRSRTRTLILFHATAALALCRLAQDREDEARELAESLVEHMLEIDNAFALTAARAIQAEPSAWSVRPRPSPGRAGSTPSRSGRCGLPTYRSSPWPRHGSPRAERARSAAPRSSWPGSMTSPRALMPRLA